ncbi:MAG TPA: phenylalanine--tRNA ligase subunit alpha [Bacteroidia bacterium]|jgi:phenylalanyl-tRNA synthetase alpha chain|nr:phenylalanine--tRNA ligase subunit alpha [Bacteroidia bacterium]
MKDRIIELIDEVEKFEGATAEKAEQFRLKFLSRKGEISVLFDEFKNVTPDLKKEVGQLLNKLKVAAQEKLDSFKAATENISSSGSTADLTLPVSSFEGSRHPLQIIRREILSIFGRIGFTVADGPEIEDDWHNFSALNFPEEHPARDMQDTFFIDKEIALRTHTSSVQVRVLEKTQPPVRIVMPGRVYRNEAISARAHCFFHQVEGLYVDKNVSFADMKQTLLYFSREMFGEKTEIRLRPSYFPFTEPSAEMDISCTICHGKGCTVCKHSGWVEILGCGMVDPAVLKNCKIDPEVYSGFAFGMGIERITMLKYGVNDLRLFSENDVRFLGQFGSAL